ncbi:MAG TPA: hypothetical protein VJ826_12690 [Candidatus Polarisedimenticolaceae bacterium]|nr:hypothetical protein [Candidatus Polarisedimenticolaceae bacterium]
MRTFFGTLTVALTLAGPAMAQVVRVEIDAPAETDASASIDSAGSVVYSVSTGNPFGTNPGFRKQIFRWNPATGAGTQVTSYEEGVETVSVSDDGTWLAFVSNADLIGTNHDESPELYVMQSDGTGLAQLTSTNELPRAVSRTARAVISGSANRVVFTAPIDPFGTNPTLSNAVFVIDRSGANLKQLAIDAGGIIDISDDGSKVIYSKNNQLVGINATGTGNHTFTLTTDVADASISGNGSKVVYALGTHGFPFTLRARSFDGNPATIVSLGAGERPSITDDATVVYHRRDATPAGIYKINSTGGAATLVSQGLTLVDVSGSGARLVGRNTGLIALDNAGGNLQQLTQPTFTPIHPRVEALSAGGSRGWYLAVPGEALVGELFAYDFDTGITTQLTDDTMPPFENGHFRVSDAGDVVFAEFFGDHLFKISASGAITPLPTTGQVDRALRPVIRGDGQLIVFQGVNDQQFTIGLYRMNGDGTGLALITPTGNEFSEIAISEANPETWVAFTNTTSSLYRVKTDGSGLQQITPYGSYSPSISGDGKRIAFVSDGDWAGQNAGGLFEVFVWDAATQTITQLTHEQEENYRFSGGSRITRDGQWVFAAHLRIAVDTGVPDPATGFLHPTSSAASIIPNATGSAWAFNATDVTDRSPSGSSLYRARLGVTPSIQVGRASPTVVTWDPSPGAIRYDVIRGSIGGLSISGSAVNLGPVVCLEEDSPDNHTRGFEDAAIPASGEAFFFLYRGSVGFEATAGSYGQGSGARERVAGAGGCNP